MPAEIVDISVYNQAQVHIHIYMTMKKYWYDVN